MMNFILMALVVFAVLAIAFVVIDSELGKKGCKGRHKECGFCKYFEPCRGNTTIGNCMYFFKTFKPWNTACHRFEEKVGAYED